MVAAPAARAPGSGCATRASPGNRSSTRARTPCPPHERSALSVMPRKDAIHYSPPFPYGDAAGDAFFKEDIQKLAVAVDEHDHTTPNRGQIVDHNGLANLLVGNPHPQ